MNTRLGLQHGYIDAEIQPAETRAFLIEQLHLLSHKPLLRRLFHRKHGNIPL